MPTRSSVCSFGSTFNAILYPFSPLYGEHEFHASARGTRLSLLAEGNINSTQTLADYEAFNGVGGPPSTDGSVIYTSQRFAAQSMTTLRSAGIANG
jgi:hypothetical protein